MPPEGAVIGRAGAKADIALRDPGVSKKHARVYEQAGVWYLQDEGSSNGTFLQGQRLTGPVVLAEGSVFGMSRHKFKVTRIEAEGTSEQPQVGASLYGGESFLSEPSVVRPKERTGVSAREAAQDSARALPSLAPLEAGEEEEAAEEGKAAAFAAEPLAYDAAPRTSPDASLPHDLQPQAPLQAPASARVGAGLTRALPSLRAAVPRLMVSPRKAAADSIRSLPQEDMDGVTLVGFALPAFAAAALFQGLCTFLAGLLSEGEVLFSALFPWVALLAAGGSAALTGLLFHPVTGWLIEALRGASDVRGRSNLFANLMGALLLSQGASGLALLLTALPLPFVAVLAALLQAWTFFVTVVVLHQWLQHFGVLPIARHAVLALGAVGALAIGSLGLLSSFEGPVEGAPVAQGLSAPEGDGPAPSEPQEVATAMPAGVATASPTSSSVPEQATGDSAPVAAARTEPPRGVLPLPKAPADFSYPQFRERRDKMEDALNRDVTLLSRVRGALEAYREFHRVKHEVERRYQQATEETPAEVRVNERLAEQELYLRAHPHVQAFWQAVERYRP